LNGSSAGMGASSRAVVEHDRKGCVEDVFTLRGQGGKGESVGSEGGRS